jgi:hypothetical protein
MEPAGPINYVAITTLTSQLVYYMSGLLLCLARACGLRAVSFELIYRAPPSFHIWGLRLGALCSFVPNDAQTRFGAAGRAELLLSQPA